MFGSKQVLTASAALILALAGTSLSAQEAFNALPLRIGVYGCLNQNAMEVPALQFGIIDAGTYSTFDGGRGAYTYSAAAGMLTFTSGPFAGLKRSRESERTFRVIDENGAKKGFVCPWVPKDPTKVHW